MQAKIARWGDSLAIRLPAEMVRDLGLSEGQTVDIASNQSKLEIVPHPVARRSVNGVTFYTLEELVADMDRLGPDAVPPLLNWGPDVGSEIIDDAYSRGEITRTDLGRDEPERR